MGLLRQLAPESDPQSDEKYLCGCRGLFVFLRGFGCCPTVCLAAQSDPESDEKYQKVGWLEADCFDNWFPKGTPKVMKSIKNWAVFKQIASTIGFPK